MPKWELNPYENFPQTPELYREQLEEEIQSCIVRQRYLLEEWVRINMEIKKLGEQNADTDNR